MKEGATTTPKPAVGTAKTDVTKTTNDVSAMNLWQKLAAITGEIGIIAKDGTNEQQRYKFIENAAVSGRLRDLYGKYHVDFNPEMLERTERPLSSGKGTNILVKMKFTFTNADKPSETQVTTWQNESSDYGDKGTNKAATAAAKNYQMKKFNISEKGDDPDEVGIEDTPAPEPAVPPKRITMRDAIAQIYQALKGKGFTTADDCKAALLKLANVDDVQDLKPDVMDHVSAVIETMSGDELRAQLKLEESGEAAA